MLLYKRKGREYGIFRYAALFSEIEGKLSALQARYPDNMRFDVMGYSVEGRKLFLVTLASDVSDDALQAYAQQRLALLQDPAGALGAFEKSGECPPLPILLSNNLHGTEISGTDGMFTFIDEVLDGPAKDRTLRDCVLLIAICMNPDGRSRGLDILNGNGVDLNRDWMAQTQPETRALIAACLKKYYPAILVDMHGYTSSGNVMIDACTPPHNPLVEYDLLSPSILGNAEAMAREVKRRTGLDSDIPALLWEDGWDDYAPIYTTGYFMCNGAVTHTIELNHPSEEGALIAHSCAIGTLDYVHAHKATLYNNQCQWYLRGVRNESGSPFHADYYIIQNDQSAVVKKTIAQLQFNGIAVCTNEKGDYVVPLAQPLRPLIHNMLWQGEDISDLIQNCYDVSFYSYPVMRGLAVLPTDKDDPAVHHLLDMTDTSARFASPPRLAPPALGAARVLAVTESGAIIDVLAAAGYNVHWLPFSELNTGWRIDDARYDAMVIGGSKGLFWEDAFDEDRGVGYQNSWGLRERGRREVIRAAEACKRLVLFGYAGMKVNEALRRIDADILLPAQGINRGEDDMTSNYMFNESNGSFKMRLDTGDPLCAGYGADALLYLVAPLAFKSADGQTPVRFAENCFVNGFNRDKGALDGHIAAIHKTDGDYRTALFGFDPAYRGYTDVSFGMLCNAVALVLARP